MAQCSTHSIPLNPAQPPSTSSSSSSPPPNSTAPVTPSVFVMVAVSSGVVSQRPNVSLISQARESAQDELKCVCWSFSIRCRSYTHAVDSAACLLKHMFSKTYRDQIETFSLLFIS